MSHLCWWHWASLQPCAVYPDSEASEARQTHIKQAVEKGLLFLFHLNKTKTPFYVSAFSLASLSAISEWHTHTLTQIFYLVLNPVMLKVNQSNRTWGQLTTQQKTAGEDDSELHRAGRQHERHFKNPLRKRLICKEPLCEMTVLTGCHCARKTKKRHFSEITLLWIQTVPSNAVSSWQAGARGQAAHILIYAPEVNQSSAGGETQNCGTFVTDCEDCMVFSCMSENSACPIIFYTSITIPQGHQSVLLVLVTSVKSINKELWSTEHLEIRHQRKKPDLNYRHKIKCSFNLGLRSHSSVALMTVAPFAQHRYSTR